MNAIVKNKIADLPQLCSKYRVSRLELFGRHIDLVETGAMHNPYFIRRVNESRTLIYAA